MAKASYREGLRLWQEMQQVEQRLGIVKGLAVYWLPGISVSKESDSAESPNTFPRYLFTNKVARRCSSRLFSPRFGTDILCSQSTDSVSSRGGRSE
jgi:hypothetical protein